MSKVSRNKKIHSKPIYLALISIVFSVFIFFLIYHFISPSAENNSHFPPNTVITKASGPYAYKNTTNEFSTYFKEKPTDTNSIAFANNLGKISFYTPKVQSFGELNSKTTPVSKGSTLTYPEIFPQTDLIYTISTSRLLEEFVIKDKETANKVTRIKQIANTNNKYTINSDGSVTFTDNKNKIAFSLPAPVLYEKNDSSKRSTGIKYEIEKNNGNQLSITKVITPDGLTWLNDKSRSYPIVIDLVIDNADTASNWISSDTDNTVVSQETVIKQEGSGSVKVTTTAESTNTIDLMEYSSDSNAQTAYVSNGASIIATGGTITKNNGYTIHTFYTGGTFTVSSGSNTVEYLIVAGGGGGGSSTGASAGGGGGGGFLTGSTSVSSGSYTVTVGNGGNGGSSGTSGTSGGNSSFNSITATGGGGGGAGGTAGLSGGSGGGGGTNLGAGGNGTAGQGNNGGTAQNNGTFNAGGGGGAGAVGAGSGSLGNGGAGLSSSISGTTLFYAGGGAGGSLSGGSTFGGSSIGGDVTGSNGTAAVVNRGSGGGGSRVGSGGAGSAGVVIIRYKTSPLLQAYTNADIVASGGTIATISGNTIHTFTSNGNFNTISGSSLINYLIVAGGGGGGSSTGASAGGGGGGGLITDDRSVATTNLYAITIGNGGGGGTSGANGTSGGNSSLGNIATAIGGGGGGGSAGGIAGLAGGSGGGGGTNLGAGGVAVIGQGNNGGIGQNNGNFYAGGGGGAGGVGAGGGSIGNGGSGSSSSLSGSSLFYAAGGGGGTYNGTQATGGSSIGGVGGYASSVNGGAASTANRGSGGGGSQIGSGGAGSAGVVIVSYQTPSGTATTTQGSNSLKVIAKATDSLNKTLTKTFGSPLNLSYFSSATFDIRSTRTGSNIKIGLHDTGGTTTEITPNITSANTFQSYTLDLSGVSNANKDAIDQVIITIVNADADNTFYLDNFQYFGRSINDTVTLTTSTNLTGINQISFWVRSTIAGSFARFQFGEVNSNEQTFNFTINSANTWERKTWDISGISTTAKDAVTKFAFQFISDTSGATFYFDDINNNQPPNTPTFFPSYQHDKVKIFDTTPEIRFSGTDPENNDLVFQIQYDTDSSFPTPTTINSDVDSGFSNITTPSDTSPFNVGDTISYTFQTPLTNNVTYFYRVRSNDPGGSIAYSPWSIIKSLTIDTSLATLYRNMWFETHADQFATDTLSNTVADSPTNSLQLSSSTGYVISTPITAANLSSAETWKAITFTNQAGANHTFQLFYDVAGTPTIIPDSALPGNSSGFTTSPINLSTSSLHLLTSTYPIVYLKSNLSNTAATPILYDWGISLNYIPSTPSLDSPINGSTSEPILAVFKTTAIDNDSDTLKYKIILCLNAAMTTGCKTFDQTVASAGWSNSTTPYASGAQATYTIQLSDVLTSSTTYYWKSYAIDLSGSNLWSSTQSTPYSFTTNTPPTIPTLDLPLDGATEVTTTTVFKTTSTDPEGNTLRYKIILCSDPSMTVFCQTFDQTSGQAGWSGQNADNTGSFTSYTSGTQATYTVTTNLPTDRTFYWKSYAKDTYGSNTWSATQATPYSFSTFSQPATPAPCSTFKAINNSNITVNWTDTSSTEDYFQVYKSTDNSTFTQLGSNLAPNTIQLIDSAVSTNHSYAYQIRSHRTDGANSIFSNWCTTSTTHLNASGSLYMEGINLD